MNSDATILDDRETVELLCNHPDLLAIADAVRVTQRQPTRGLATRRRVVVAAVAAVVACAAAALAVVFSGALGGSNAAGDQSNRSFGSSGAAALIPDPVPVSQALSDATKSFGVGIALPDASLLKHSDTPWASEQWSPAAYPGGPSHLTRVDVGFNTPPYVTIAYALTEPSAPPPTYAGGTQTVHLSDGTPALISLGPDGNAIDFRIKTVSVWIWAPSHDGVPTTVSGADLQAMAQSILDQASSASP